MSAALNRKGAGGESTTGYETAGAKPCLPQASISSSQKAVMFAFAEKVMTKTLHAVIMILGHHGTGKQTNSGRPSLGADVLVHVR